MCKWAQISVVVKLERIHLRHSYDLPRSSATFIWAHYRVPLDRRFSFRTGCVRGRGYGRRVTDDGVDVDGT